MSSSTRNHLSTPSKQARRIRSVDGKEYEVWKMSLECRRCNDEIHKTIEIPPAAKVVLDTPPIQRLGQLKQLGCTYMTYPCCTHTRKEHSLGVMQLAGKLATKLKYKQPGLNISEMDILCVRLAGLCHDLGHGPFSHAYEAFLQAAFKNEKSKPHLYKERNDKFMEKYGVEMPPLEEHWEHENASLMMIDEVLASIGLEIDWENLDEPLKQIGDGYDAKNFGAVIDSCTSNKEEVQWFTSRDWIFIKECVYGQPLKYPHKPHHWHNNDFEGRGVDKEFLYDIVNNRHNGLDVDKIDYYARDLLAAKGKGEINEIIFEESAVAIGKCPNHKKCFKCKGKLNPDMHFMICYPYKLVQPAMDFFSERKKNHREIYTHKKTKGSELFLVDLLLEADRQFGMLWDTQHDDEFAIPTSSHYRQFSIPRLPISRAWMYPRLYLRLDDSVVGKIEELAIREKAPKSLREKLNQHRHHAFYRCAGEALLSSLGVGGPEVWEMTPDEIRNEMLMGRPQHNDATLKPDDVIVEKKEIHCGRKEKNPVSQMRFFHKSQRPKLKNPIHLLPEAEEVDRTKFSPTDNLIERSIRVFSRCLEKDDLVSHAFQNWEQQRKDGKFLNCILEEADGNSDVENDGGAVQLTQDSDTMENDNVDNDTMELGTGTMAIDIVPSPPSMKRRKRKDAFQSPKPAKKSLSFSDE